jgi:hypothetical protein
MIYCRTAERGYAEKETMMAKKGGGRHLERWR